MEILNLSRDPKTYLGKWQNWVKFIVIATLFCLFRNNALYVLIITIPIVVLLFKNLRIKTLILFVIPAGLYIVINGPVYDALGVYPVNAREAMSVPMQQISAVLVRTDDFSEERLWEINNYIDVEKARELYNPRFSDPVKDNAFNTEYFTEHELEFIKLWVSLGLKYPEQYISSFLSLNLPDWFPDARAMDEYSQRYYIEDGLVDYDGSILPWLRDGYYRVVANGNLLINTPILSIYSSISLPIWVVLFTFIYLLSRERKYAIAIFAPLILLFGTYILSPVSNVRFMLPFIALIPLYIALILQVDKYFTRQNRQ